MEGLPVYKSNTTPGNPSNTMRNFNNYLALGYEHIIDFGALDHILFLVALVSVYQVKNWLRFLLAVTFFAIGHSATLALGTFKIVEIDNALIEFLIPLTIVIVALYNIAQGSPKPRGWGRYWLAGIFGLIHGMGFSNSYQMLVMGDQSVWQAMLPFNLGIELGLLLVALVLIIALFIYQIILNKKGRDWNLFFSGVAFGLALIMCFEQWPFGKLLT